MNRFLLFSILTTLSLTAFAVTDKEMEEAKTITAITYLRYANDGSGYLDGQHPKTMAELQSILKKQEKENLKAFNAVRVPSDYPSWDKEKLIAYWAGTFYSSPGLLEKGKVGKSRTRSRLTAMTLSSPAKADQAEKAEEPAQAQEAVPAEPLPAETESAAAAAMVAAATEEFEAQTDSVILMANADAGTAEDQPAKSNPTWIYILILTVLVGVVVWLVVYASRTMNRDSQQKHREEIENGTAPMSGNVAERAANAAMREKYSESLNQKNTELRQALKEVTALRAEVETLRQANSGLEAEITRLRNGLAAMAGATAPQPSTPQATDPVPTPARPQPRIIYLGRVNPRGLFVRADKAPHPELSVYRLDTEDGYTGTFRVIENHSADSRLLSNPAEWLAGGCTGLDALQDDPDATLIDTLSGGTAIFEGGAWKVIRKARISFR